MSNKNIEEIEKIASQMEALLFVFGEALDKHKISLTLKTDSKKIEEAAEFLKAKYLKPESGIMLISGQDKYMLATKPEHSTLVEDFVSKDLKEELTPAALETLSIIAYFGPVTRAQIDYIRGVNSSFILRSLMIRGLIERKATKGLAYEYEVSFDFLKYMGIDNISKMPNYQEYQKFKEQYFAQQQEDKYQENNLNQKEEKQLE
jgi:segregation and condensation protein B